MPAGVTWPKYLKFVGASFLSMFAGAQLVHSYYRPLDDLDELMALELKRRQKELDTKGASLS